jgi:transketolase
MKKYTYTQKKDTRSGFGAGLAELGRTNPNVVALCADLIGSLKMNEFIDENPERFFQIGIAEANMMGIAAGLTIGGKIPFTGTFANFSTGRLMKMLPGMVVINTCDYNQTKAATIAIAKYDGPVYLRFGRPSVPIFTDENQTFKIGKAINLTEGNDVTIVATGHLVWEALQASEKLFEKGISAEVINIHTIKPLDKNAILESVKKTGCIVTAEEHNYLGGLGESVSRVLSLEHPTPQEFVATNDTFGESGTPTQLMEKYGLNANTIVEKVNKVLKRK